MKRKLYLSRQYNGQYMLTALKPLRHKVGTTDHEDLYVVPGESLGIRNICTDGVRWLLPGVELAVMESVVISLEASYDPLPNVRPN